MMESRSESQESELRQEAASVAAEYSGAESDKDRTLWQDFAEAATVEHFCRGWLAIQCRLLGGIQSGMVLLGPPDRGPFRPVAVWPDPRMSVKHLTKTAERTLSDRRGLVVTPESEAGQAASARWPEVGYPIEVRGRIHGVAVLEVTSRQDARLKAVMRQLHWGAAWLELLFCREDVQHETARRERLQTALDLVASGLGQDRFFASATAFVTALATKLRCDRVSVGFAKAGRTHVEAVSHNADFKKQTNLMRAVATAMDEALDQRATLVYPAPPNSTPLISRAHGELARQHGAGAICSVPLLGNQGPLGVLTLERPGDLPFDPATVELCESVAALAGPILDTHRREDRWVLTKLLDAGRTQLSHLFGAGHLALKLGTAAVAGLLAFCLLAKGDYRVSAKTVLEPVLQRAAVAPFNSYVREAPVRAGDIVAKGHLLALLDDRELKLERLKALSEAQEYQKQLHKAMAERKASDVEIITAQIAQARAKVDLLDDQLSRTRITAPFDALVVTGDLSQMLGSPLEKGKVLFELAPADQYRLVVQVDERDVADVTVGQRGTLLLSAFPHDPLSFAVEKVTPVSEAKEGRNYFRIEARFDQPPPRLRPGMEGVGKVEIDERRLIWIWTHQVVDWVRLALWTWLP